MDKTFTKEEISSVLQKGVATVSFKKVDGNIRIMECTLNAGMIPPPKEPKKTDRVKTPNNAVLSVWDVNKDGWRSFRVENVFAVETPQENLDL